MARRVVKKATIADWFRLIRWKNTLVALICVAIAFSLGESKASGTIWITVMLTVGLVFAAGNILNDYSDYKTDIEAHPRRPIPRGAISRKNALTAGIVTMSIGLAIGAFGAAFYGPVPAIIAVAAGILLLFYDFAGKGIPLLGNSIVALLGGLVFIYAGTTVGLNVGHIYAACFAALFHLGREIVKDIADRFADEKAGIKTIPQLLGADKTARIALMPLLAIIPLSVVPFATGRFSLWYLGAVILFVDLPLALFAWILPGATSPRRASKCAGDMKWIMAGGIVALLLGGLTA